MQDVDLVQYRWRTHLNHGYSYARSSTLQLLHRIILERVLGRTLTRKEQVDHINGDTLDNRRENLRLATHAQNQQNRKVRSDSKSGYKGVWYRSDTGKWCAEIKANRKRYCLGSFGTPEDAYKAYCDAAKELHGEFARTA